MSARRPSLGLTRPLLRWLQASPQWRSQPLSQRLQLRWLAALGSFNAGLSARAAADHTPRAAPVLIAGPWRSGTTVMHELLAAATGLPTPRTWQCMNASAFALGTAPRGSAVTARPMDGLLVDALAPQEDEFALLTLGAPSAYRAFWQPERLPELHHTVSPRWWLQQTQWWQPWLAFLGGVLRAEAASPATPLLLKSPNHSWRLPAIAQRFPACRVVWMARPAAQLVHSNRKLWQAMAAQHALGDARFDHAALDGFLAAALSGAAEVLTGWALQQDAARLVVVPHAALQVQPADLARRVAARLQLPLAGEADDALREAAARIAQGRIEQYADADWAADLQRAVAGFDEAQGLALQRLGL